MPSYWLVPKANISVPFPERNDVLSEDFYGLVGAGYNALFDAFPPVFTQIQRIAGVDVDSLLPLYISSRFTEEADMPGAIARVSKDLDTVRARFLALREALLRRPGWTRALTLPEDGYAPARAYFEHFASPPPPELTEEQALDLELGILDPEELVSDEPSFREDMGLLLRYLDHAKRHGGTRFWFLGR